MISFLGATETIIFSIAIMLMLLIGIVEAVGLGVSGFDLDIDSDGWLNWLGIGEVPLLILVVTFLASFGLLGLIGQQIWLGLTGDLASALIAAPVSAALSLPLTRLLGRGLARIIPHDETTAINRASLIGLSGVIEIGKARIGSPARAKVTDHFGQAHYIMVEPDSIDQHFEQGDLVLIVRKNQNVFQAILDQNHRYQNWIES
ncbi:MAG: YqiJ family protein [Pseudomonadota bacterium]